MWTRKELKERGKFTFNLNYWKTVLVALIMSVILGGLSGMGAAATGGSGGSAVAQSTQNVVEESGSSSEEVGELIGEEFGEDIPPLPEEVQPFIQPNENAPAPGDVAVLATVLVVLLIIFLVILVMAILLDAFLLNPLEVGGRRFFVQNLHMPAEVKEIAFGYDHCYKNIVKTMFFRDLYLVLWSLLFIIPGIIKSYEYRMIPYILAEHPEMAKADVFAKSRAMMKGQKWRTFVLDLSFLGWEILSALTLGILGLFYVSPYRNMTNAALYEALEYGGRQEESVVWTES